MINLPLLFRHLVHACLAGLLLAVSLLRAAGADSPGVPVIPLDKPFTFAYLAWEGKARIDGGVVLLDQPGLTPKGGAGVVGNFDLGPHADDCLALRVLIGSRNTLKVLKLLLRDAAGHSGTWFFPLPAPAAGSVVVTPVDGAPLARANDISPEGAPDPARIMQWQLLGDWSGDAAVDLRVEAILAVPPDAAIRQARAGLATREANARSQAEKERLDGRARYGKRTAASPKIEAVYAAAPEVLALQIRAGRITPSRLLEYQAVAGDITNKEHHLIRAGRDLGVLIGRTGKEDGLVTGEGFSGDPLLLAEADDTANYRVSSPDDPAFATPVAPAQIWRKSKADDWQQFTQGGVVVVHRIYLRLTHPLIPGKTYSVSLGQVNADQAQATLVFDPSKVWTEVIHVQQIGFRPDDPLKHAFLSWWTGNGGGFNFPTNLVFHLVDTHTGRSVYEGKVGAAWAADQPEKLQSRRNFNDTAVATLDFSTFRTPGEYRLVIDRIGCSYPFTIGAKVWEKAFQVQMKGFYNERSGVALGPPYTDFVRPVCWKPGVSDCVPITQSTYSVVDGNPNGRGNLAQGDTGKPVPEAWGGYHDAGDWNPRRIDHMRTTTFWQLELLQLFPEYFASLPLNIPNDAPGPDLLKECLFELDLFRRLQLPDGGVRHGIETDGDPFGGEVSWKQHMPGYVYAPDIYSSYIFAAVAARAAQVLEHYDAKLAATYAEAARKAMDWAEADRARRVAGGTWDRLPNLGDAIHQHRNLAAVCLYALTRDPHWNEVFLADTVLKTNDAPQFYGNLPGRDAAFTYARLPEGMGDPNVKKNSAHACRADAERALEYGGNNAFGLTADDPGKP